MDYPVVSIIIINFNGRPWLTQCLESLRALDYPKDKLEIMIGDNASTDDSVSFIGENYPFIKILQFDDNYGFCRSNNLCAARASGEYLAFLNNDAFVMPEWIKNLVNGMQSDPKVVSCASKILFPHLGHGTILNAAGGVIALSGGGLYEGWMDRDSPAYGVQKYTAFGCGAGVMVQKKFFLETGGFHEYYFYGVEEMDLGLRAWLYGYKVLYVPEAVMYHYMGKTGYRAQGVTPTVEFLNMRNSFYFILKNFEIATMPRAFLLYFARGLIKMAYALLRGNFSIPWAILKGWGQAFRDTPHALEARRGIQKNRKMSDKALIQAGVLASFWETLRRNGQMAQRTKQVVRHGWYDTKDSVEMVLNQKKLPVFRKKE